MSSWETASSQTFHISNEYDHLTHVILGTSRGYEDHVGADDNADSEHSPGGEQSGTQIEYKIELELSSFRSALEENGIQVYHPIWIDKCPHHQIAIRDIGFIIGDTLVISNMQNQNRTLEFEGIRHLISQWEGRVTLIPDSLFLQGRDILVDGHRIYVGSGKNSSPEAINFIKKNFYEKYDVIPVALKTVLDGEDVPHLDNVFNVLGHKYALIYTDGIKSIPPVIGDEYQWIELTREEASMLGAGVLSINPDTIISNSHESCWNINSQLREIGFHVIEVNFSNLASIGYSFRSTSLPLLRHPE